MWSSVGPLVRPIDHMQHKAHALPLLCPYGSDCFTPFVRECKELPQAASLFIPGLSGAVLFNGEVPNTKVLALHCDLAHQFLMDLFPV